MPVTRSRLVLALTAGLAAFAALGASAGLASAATVPAPVSVAIVVPILAPANETGLIDADALAQYTSPAGLLSRELDAVIGTEATIAIDPMIIASIRVLGNQAPASATAWLERLAAAGNDSFALAYADSDLTLGLQAGSPAVLAVQSLDFAIAPDRFSPAVTPEPTASPTPTPTTDPGTAPPLPTSDDLLAWDYSLESIAWPSDGTVRASDLGTIAAAGFSSTIVDSASLTAVGSSPVASVDGSTVIVSDNAVSTALRSAVSAISQDAYPGAFESLVGALSAASTTPTATVVATLGRGLLPSGSRLAETLANLSATPNVRIVPLSTALAIAPTPATITDGSHPTETSARVALMLAAEAEDARFATVAADPLPITAERRLALMALTSHAWESNPDGWVDAVNGFLADSATLRDSVRVTEGSTINLLADRASLPITVGNSLDQPVTVFITVRPETALLKVEDSLVKLTIEPGAQAKGQIPVQAISNGTARVTVTLLSPEGVPIGAPTTAEINVQAGWETPVTIGLGIAVVLVFAAGVIRTILRRRRLRAESTAG